jgi:hypothetical protein
VKRAVLCLLPLLFAACDNWNLPVKDNIAFLSAMTPVSSLDELQQAVEDPAGPELIALTTGFPAGSATITVSRSVTIAAVPDRAAVITRTGAAAPLFTVSAGGGLTLGHPAGGTLVLDGGAGSGIAASSPLVRVTAGNLTVDRGAELRNNDSTSGDGGGVYVSNGGFTMTGGTISGNSASIYGGGVFVNAGGSGDNAGFTMTGGTISGNSASTNGGGVAVDAGSGAAAFTMTGGTISGNKTSGGVYVSAGSGAAAFTMTGGTISGNKANTSGGGVSVVAGSGTAAFTMEGGTISGNSDGGYSYGGGGVSVGVSSSGGAAGFTMTGGIISGNSGGYGGGVSVSAGWGTVAFTMEGGTISGNKASTSGGGVFVNGSSGATFKKSGGVIYGSDGGGNSNIATGDGHAVYLPSGGMKRNTTAGAAIPLYAKYNSIWSYSDPDGGDTSGNWE